MSRRLVWRRKHEAPLINEELRKKMQQAKESYEHGNATDHVEYAKICEQMQAYGWLSGEDNT